MHAWRGVTRPRLCGAALGGDGAKAGDVIEAVELPSIAEGAGCGVDGVLHADTAEVDGHANAAHQATSSASKTGPSMQVLA